MKITLFISIVCGSFALQAQSNVTWDLQAQDVSASGFGNMHPRISQDRSGNPLLVWGRMSDASVMFSRWNGTNFTTPTKLNPPGFTVATASWMGPDIAAHGDTVYVIVKRTPENIDSNYIYILRSFDGGQNFLSPVRVDVIADSISRFPTLTTDALGNPLVAFMKFNASFYDSRWVVSKSTDLGNTFSNDVLASGWGGSTEVCDCCPGSILSDGNNTAVLYRNNNNNIRDTWMGVSTNNSNSFLSGCAVENNNWMLMNCPATGPDGIIIGDTVHSVFMNGASGKNLIYYSKSTLSNTSLSYVTALTGNFSGLTQQNFPRIEKFGNAVGVVWKQVVNGMTELSLLFTNNITTGFPMTQDTVDLGNVTNTDLIINQDKVFIVWEDDNSGTVKYRLGSYVSNTADLINTDFYESIKVYPNPSEMFWNIDGDWNNQSIVIRISDLLGHECFSDTYNQVNKQSEISISNGSLAKGIYTLEIVSSLGTKIVRVVKN